MADRPSLQSPPGQGGQTWPFPVEDPYPAYARMRSEAPVSWNDGLRAWLVLSHSAATEVLRSRAWSADPRRSPELMARLAPGFQDSDILSKMLLFSDPPDHDRLRAAVNRYFTPRRVETIRHRTRSIIDATFDGQDGEVDFLDQVAYPVPLAVICELFNVDTDTALLLRDETPAMTATLDLLAPPDLQAEAAAAAMAAVMALVPIVAERKRSPGDDLLSVLAARLEPEEAVVTALLLLVAGHETTSALIANAVVAVADRPVEDTTVEDFVEETLRWDSPVQVTGRVAAADLDLAGYHVRKGEQALVIIGAANRDPAVFDNPDQFDPGRAHGGHLAFGHGLHFCVGAALARMETAEVLRHMVTAEWKLVGYERAESSTFRRMRKLVVLV